MSGEKYYDDKYHPKSTYPRNDGTTTFMKSIRLTKEEIDIWNKTKLSKRIHKILAGEDKSNDSIKINKLRNDLIILKKLIPAFVENELKVNLEDQEIDRIKQLWSEITNE